MARPALPQKTKTDHPLQKPMNARMDVDVAVNDKGDLFVFHTRPFPERLEWVEFDSDDNSLTFITRTGRLHGLGVKMKPEHYEYFKLESHICVIWAQDKKIRDVYDVPLLTR